MRATFASFHDAAAFGDLVPSAGLGQVGVGGVEGGGGEGGAGKNDLVAATKSFWLALHMWYGEGTAQTAQAGIEPASFTNKPEKHSPSH